jgi:hypothetical protein
MLAYWSVKIIKTIKARFLYVKGRAAKEGQGLTVKNVLND